MAFIIALLEFVFARLIGEELLVRWPKLTSWLVSCAVKMLPIAHRADREEEWLGVVRDLRAPITQLFHCIDFFRAAYSLKARETAIANKRDWVIVGGILQVLAGAALLWVFERIENFRPIQGSRLLRRIYLGILTYMVQGEAKMAQAHLAAADGYSQVGNVELANAAKIEGEKVIEQVLDHMVDVGLAHALFEMADKTI